jgi:hypothetical protein
MMATLLRRVGIKVKSIYQVYPKKRHERIQDPTWIEKCGKKGWIAISGDKRLEKNIENLTAIITHKVKVFILTDTNSLPEEWAAAVIVGQEKISSVVNKNAGVPLFSSIQRRSLSHVSHARFPKLQEEAQHEQKETIAGADQNPAGLQADGAGSTGDSAGTPEAAEEKKG